jgi:hypothetical protein
MQTRLFAFVLLLASAFEANAQGIVSAGIQGTLRTRDDTPVERATVTITNRSNGHSVRIEARQGRYLAHGLEPGGPYSISVRALGFLPHQVDVAGIALGQIVEAHITLQRIAAEIAPTTIRATEQTRDGGTGTLLGENLLHGLPNLNRDLYDFVRLVPQVSTRISLANTGFSAGGVGFRFNNFLIGGVSERTIGGSVSSAFGGTRSIPIDAVKEYQVLLAPYDVRYGDFTGALVNAVTKTGTNTLTGSAFVHARNDRLSRDSSASGRSRYDRVQYGVSVGGPVIRDRLHFFLAADLQSYDFPAPGPFVGQSPDADPPVPVRAQDLERLEAIMRGYGLTAGSSGAARNGNPLRNFFSRADMMVPSLNTRISAWRSAGESEELVLSRQDSFRLSSARAARTGSTSLTAIQAHTALQRRGGGHNELLLAIRGDKSAFIPDVRQPAVRVLLPRNAGGREAVATGAPEQGHGVTTRASLVSVKDNLTVPIGRAHTITVGAEAEWTGLDRKGVPNGYGSWTFVSLDDLQAGFAERYEVGLDLGSATVPLRAAQYAAYVSERWQPSRGFSLTLGLRADMLDLRDEPKYHPGVDTIFGERTDRTPRNHIELSPRAGFILQLPGADQQVRGGIGVFTTRYPLAWAHSALLSNGSGSGVLRCGRTPNDLGLPPAFNPDPFSPPTACANGATITDSRRGDVNLLAHDLRMMRLLRSSIAYERALSRDTRVSGEILASSALADFFFVNRMLREPVGEDRNGRVMYGTITASGAAAPNLLSGFSEVIEVVNKPHTRAIQLSALAEKGVSGRVNAMASYTYSRVRDAMSPSRVNTRGLVTWGSARVVSGRHDDTRRTVSANDIPHRFALAGTYAVPRRWRTEVSFYYLGESGRPFTYIASGTSRRGDLNADGVATNDPVYVPRDAFDAAEILFDGTPEMVRVQQENLEAMITNTPCLRKQRGRILARNSCREPWSNTTIATLRQRIPSIARGFEAQLDIFNVLNLLHSDWGVRRTANTSLLEHVAQAGPSDGSRPVFVFDSTRPLSNVDHPASAFQLQAAVRYRF